MTKKKLTKKQKEFVDLVKNIIGSRRRYDIIDDILEKNGFCNVNSGGYKSVFKREDDDFCVKVWYNSWGWREDSYKVPVVLKNHYVYPLYMNRRYMIQLWIKGEHSDYGYTRPVKKLPHEVRDSVYDIRDDNIRVYGNREVVIDFCYANLDFS